MTKLIIFHLLMFTLGRNVCVNQTNLYDGILCAWQ